MSPHVDVVSSGKCLFVMNRENNKSWYPNWMKIYCWFKKKRFITVHLYVSFFSRVYLMCFLFASPTPQQEAQLGYLCFFFCYWQRCTFFENFFFYFVIYFLFISFSFSLRIVFHIYLDFFLFNKCSENKMQPLFLLSSTNTDLKLEETVKIELTCSTKKIWNGHKKLIKMN